MHRSDDTLDDVIDRFLANRMTEDERAAFELRMLDDDALFERVQRADSMQEAMREEAARGGFDLKGLSEAGTISPAALLNWIRQPLSMAACLLLGLSFVLNVLVAGGEEGEANVLPVRSFALLETTRSGAEGITIRNPGPHLLQVDVGFIAATAFDIAMVDQLDGALVFSESDVGSDGQGWLRVVVQTIPPGEYRLVVSWEGGEQEYPLAVEPREL